MRTHIARLKGHYIVCGFGRVGREVALTLQGESVPLVVDRDVEALADAQELGMLHVHGDPTRDDDLLAAPRRGGGRPAGRYGHRRRQRPTSR